MKFTFTALSHIVLVALSYYAHGQSPAIHTARKAPIGSVVYAEQMRDLNLNPSGFVDGYVKKEGNTPFLFPVGNKGAYRPFGADAHQTSGAYFRENPSTTVETEHAPFNASRDEQVLGNISEVEFWDINGENPARLTLTWNEASGVGALTNNTLNLLTIAGWNKNTGRWEKIASAVDKTSVLGGTSSLTSGSITVSTPVKPGDFCIYTLAGLLNPDQGSNYQGSFESASCTELKGWIWDVNYPATELVVELIEGDRVYATTRANLVRQDVAGSGVGKANVGFVLKVPPQFLGDNVQHQFSIRVQNTDYILDGSPKSLACSFDGRFEASDCYTLSGWAQDKNNLSSRLDLEILDGTQLLAETKSMQTRQAGDDYGFSITVPAALRDGRQHSVSVRAKESGYILSGSPQNISCPQSDFKGNFEIADCNTLSGWVWDKVNPDNAVTIQILDGTRLMTEMSSNQYREDLKNAGNGTGKYGFTIPTMPSLRDGNVHNMIMRVKGTNYVIGETKTMTCATASYRGSFETANCKEISGWIYDNNNLSSQVMFEVMEGGVVHTNGIANLNRTDLQSQGIGTGKYGFSISLPAALMDGNAHAINIRIAGTNIKLPGTKTVTCNPNGAAPNYAGAFESADCNEVKGYVWDQNRPEGAVTVELMEVGTVIATTTANLERADLRSQNIGTGMYGFTFSLPATLKDGVAHTLTVRIKDTSIRLAGAKTLTCLPSGNPPSYAGAFESGDCSEIKGYVWDQNHPDAPVTVELMEVGTVIATMVATLDRADLRTQGIGTGKYGFSFIIPDALKDGAAHNLTVRIKDTNIRLAGGKTLTCTLQRTNPPAYAGSFEFADCSELTGYIWDKNNPDNAVTVELMEGGLVHTTVVANLNRADLKNQGMGTGMYGFSIPLPANLKDATAHALTIRIKGTSIRLPGTKTITCSANGNPPNYAGAFEFADCTEATGYVWDQNNTASAVTVELLEGTTVIATAVANVLRLDMKNQGMGTGLYGFEIPIPAGLKDGAAHALNVRIKGANIKLPFTRTISCLPVTEAPNYAGSFEYGDCNELSGYVWDKNNPSRAVTVELMEGGYVHAKVIANGIRTDLKNQGMGTGLYGFNIPVPAALRDGNAHVLNVRIRGTNIKLPFSRTINCAQNGATPSFAGAFEAATCTEISGWAFDQKNPNTPLTLELMEGGILHATVTAGIYRADLKNQGMGTGSYGFSIPVPASLKDGAPHTLTIRIKGTTVRLAGAKTLNCSAGGLAPSYAGSFEAANCTELTGYVWDQNNPGSPVMVELMEGGAVLAVATADVFRQNLKDQGMGTGQYGFAIPLPAAIRDGRSHSLNVRIKGTSIKLPFTRVVTCSSNVRMAMNDETVEEEEDVAGIEVAAKPEAFEVDLSVSPNPSRGLVSARFVLPQAEQARLSLFNLLGQQMSSLALNGDGNEVNKQFDLSTYPDGVYMIRVERATGVVTKRLVLTK